MSILAISNNRHVVIGAIAGAAGATVGVALTSVIAPALGIGTSAAVAVTGIRAAAQLASVGVFAAAKATLWGGAVGAGVGAVAAAVADPGDDKPTDEPREDETVTTQLVRKGDAEVAAARKGHDRCPECKRTSQRYCWHL
ncbi:hypothetical protein DFH94DRAFT_789559 [Russula ochroleuca]|uniref:Uncharacterized protein n=1 Tax=Russula ochroleuca TaxID=152965 RepID=A0A9P5JTT7_9AGAM|nr:hypothetical protein DFH94DRAFT_789559 [Russula ochroleuca]